MCTPFPSQTLFRSEVDSSPLIQRIIHDFANSSAFPDHIAKVQREYRARRDCILAAVGRDLPEARIAIPEGGYYVWLTLPDRVDGDLLAARAADAGVHLIAGSRF